ncbi:MAG: AAA family ATPase [Bacteroidales bacterium]|nr:AAA family ATPase [Bacteroidales bacterium]
MNINETQIRLWFDTMVAGRLVEIRMLSSRGATFSGVFEDADSIINSLREFPETDCVKGIYYTLNPLKDYCRQWPQYGRIIQADKTASDVDIARREWLLVDIDPKRPSGVSATDEEKDNARFVADAILKLYDIEIPSIDYFPNPKIIVDSGNGYHLLWRCDMENTQESAQVVRTFLQTLNTAFGTVDADVDTSVYNASRISKLPGTWARKGLDSQERPHRMSRVLKVIPDDSTDTIIADDFKAVIDHFSHQGSIVSETSVEALHAPDNNDIAKVLRDVDSCIRQLEAKGVRIPADRDRWHTILAGWYHTLGIDGLDSFLRFSALWENNDPQEDRAKYLEISKYPHPARPASIALFYEFCKEYGVTPEYDWRQWQIDITQEQPDPIPLITRNGRMFLTRNNLCTIVGRPKAGKSTLLTAIVATAYTGRDCLGFSSEGHLKTLWIDTEQAPDDSSRMWRGVYRLAEVPVYNDDALVFLRLLETPIAERLRCMEAVIKEKRPDLVIVDGVADMMRNTNDIEESQALVTAIRQINTRYECGIILILHVNWRDEKARGHLGTVLQHKSETVALLEHTAGMDSPVKVMPQLTRKAPFADFIFEIDSDTGRPVLCDVHTPVAPAIQTLLDSINGKKVYTHKELVQLMTGKGLGESNAKKYIGESVKRGYLTKLADGYAINDDDLPG